jgi:light-harvesting complex I chlorophyll a/b binding protein 1
VTSGKSQTDAFWDVWAEHPNYVAFGLVIIALLESTRTAAMLCLRELKCFWLVELLTPVCFGAPLRSLVATAISGFAATSGRETGLRAPGDFTFNPLKYPVTEAMKMKEVANGRLAMWGAMGLIVQGMTTHQPAIMGDMMGGL